MKYLRVFESALLIWAGCVVIALWAAWRALLP